MYQRFIHIILGSLQVFSIVRYLFNVKLLLLNHFVSEKYKGWNFIWFKLLSYFKKINVLFSSGYRSKIPQISWLKITKCIISRFWTLEIQNGNSRAVIPHRPMGSLCFFLPSGVSWQSLASLGLQLPLTPHGVLLVSPSSHGHLVRAKVILD